MKMKSLRDLLKEGREFTCTVKHDYGRVTRSYTAKLFSFGYRIEVQIMGGTHSGFVGCEYPRDLDSMIDRMAKIAPLGEWKQTQ